VGSSVFVEVLLIIHPENQSNITKLLKGVINIGAKEVIPVLRKLLRTKSKSALATA
jgi:hypothetical protein